MAHNIASLHPAEAPGQKVDTAEAPEKIEDMVADHVSAVSEPMTWQQIREQYPDQWVFLVDVLRPEGESYLSEFRTARVAAASRSRRESLAFDRSRIEGYHHYAHHFTGKLTRSIAHLFDLHKDVPA